MSELTEDGTNVSPWSQEGHLCVYMYICVCVILECVCIRSKNNFFRFFCFISNTKLNIFKNCSIIHRFTSHTILILKSIALLSVFFSKLLQKLRYNRLMTFTEGNKILRRSMGLGRKNQLKQHYGFPSKVHRRPLRKR